MPQIVCQDGAFVPEDEARISPLSPAFQCGFTLFETLLTDSAGRSFRLDAHLARLARSAAVFGLSPVPSAAQIREIAARLCRENRISTGRMRIVLANRGKGRPASMLITVSFYRPPAEEEYCRGREGVTAPFTIARAGPCAGHKTGDFLEARIFQDGLQRGAEGILLNDVGRVCEACFANVFAVRGDTLITPPAAEGCLPGIMRAAVLETAASAGIRAEEAPLEPGELASAGEAFLTNSLIGIMPLTRLDCRPLGGGRPGPVTQRLRAACLKRIAEETA